MSDAVNPADGTRIAFEQVGEGAPIILLHGSALSRAIWRGLGYIKALREEYRVIAVDLRGHGRSDKPHRPEDYRMELIVGDVLAVLDAADAPKAHLAGYSFGARVGFSVIDEAPERVLSFVSAAGTFRSPAGSVEDLFFSGYDHALGNGGMPEFLRRWAEIKRKPVDPQTAAAFLANDPLALQAYFRQVETEPGVGESRLAKNKTHTLLLAGTNDRNRYLDSRKAASLMPNATFKALPGRDHVNTLRPSDEPLAAILPFLRAPKIDAPAADEQRVAPLGRWFR